MVTVGGRREAVPSWTHYVLKQYADQGSCQAGMVNMFWVSLVDNFQIFNFFVLLHANLILFCMQEHYRLAEGVCEDEANLIINNATCKVIKDAFKHAHCISVASYYT
jgi:hypothetical protein